MQDRILRDRLREFPRHPDIGIRQVMDQSGKFRVFVLPCLIMRSGCRCGLFGETASEEPFLLHLEYIAQLSELVSDLSVRMDPPHFSGLQGIIGSRHIPDLYEKIDVRERAAVLRLEQRHRRQYLELSVVIARVVAEDDRIIYLTESIHRICELFTPFPVFSRKNHDLSVSARPCEWLTGPDPVNDTHIRKFRHGVIRAVRRLQIDVDRASSVSCELEERRIELYHSSPLVVFTQNGRHINAHFRDIIGDHRPVDHLRHVLSHKSLMFGGRDGKDRKLSVVGLRQSGKIVARRRGARTAQCNGLSRLRRHPACHISC